MKNNHILKSNLLLAKITGVLLLSLSFFGCKKNDKNSSQGINSINHVVVIYMENHSFDNLYGQFAGANGLSNATPANTTHVDGTCKVYSSLPCNFLSRCRTDF